MPFQPGEIWKRLSPELQRQITDELSTILQEVLHEQIRIGQSSASSEEGAHLHPTVDAASGPLQSREPAAAVRPAATRSGSGLEARGHGDYRQRSRVDGSQR